MSHNKKICVVGLGYVGLPVAKRKYSREYYFIKTINNYWATTE